MAKPRSERRRIAELNRYGVLDTPRDGSFDDITSLAARFFKVPIAIISLVDADRIWFKSSFGLNEAMTEIHRGPGLCASAIMSDETYVTSDLRKDPNSLTNPLVVAELGFRFYAATPLRGAAGFNLGTICVIDIHPREFTPSDAEALESFARLVMAQMELRLTSREIASLASDLDRKNAMLAHAANHDVLTGTLNRRAIQSELDSAGQRTNESGHAAALLFDIDFFKRINDTYGHAAGDFVLKEVTRRIMANIRPVDRLGRFGGEEFLVVLDNVDTKSAVRIAERVRREVAKHPFRINGIDEHVTISAGLCLLDHTFDSDAFVRAADAALYRAKRGGRNRIVVGHVCAHSSVPR